MMTKDIKDIQGIYAALITPMTPSGAVNKDAIRKIVRWELERGVEGVYVCGSSGEGLLLSVQERKDVLETVLEENSNSVPVIAHTGTILTADVIELSRHAEKAGAVV